MRTSAGRIFVIASTLLVVVVVAAGVYLIGSPREARVRSLDHQRIETLMRLSGAVQSYRYEHDALPSSLAAASQAEPGIRPADLIDPESGAPYEYRTTGRETYELCAQFDGPAAADEEVRWRHGPGRACFPFTAPKPVQPPSLAPAKVAVP
jgi:hypothetical protein